MKHFKLIASVLLLLSLFNFAAFAGNDLYITPSEELSVKIEAGKPSYVSFIPSVNGEYAFTSLSECDTIAALYDENMNMLFTDDDGGDTSNFYISYYFKAGEKYVFSVWYYGDKICYDMPVLLKLIKPDEDHIHKYASETVVEATCNSEGQARYYCICGDFYYSSVEKLSHVFSTVLLVEPDCVSKGKVRDICSLCGECNEYVIDALGHCFSENKIVDIMPTCTSVGYESRHCLRCDKTTDKTAIPKSEHIAADFEITKEATCTANGEKVKRCSICSKVLETVTIDKAEHLTSSDYIIVKEPTCTSSGEKTLNCIICGKTLETVNIEKNKHISSGDYEIIKSPTCTANGEKVKRCSFCNSVMERISINKSSHIVSDEYEIIEASTCTAKGKRVKKCTLCSKILVTESIDKKNHISEQKFTVSKKATCTANGEKIKRCTVCKSITEKIKIEKLGHDYSKSYTVDKTATLTGSGKKSRHCKRCDSTTDIRTIPKIKSVSLEKDTFSYNGKTKSLKIIVKNSIGENLKKDKGYTVSYKKNKSIGNYKVTVKFKGDYSGTKTLSYKIVPQDITSLKVENITDSRAKLSWKKLKGDLKYRVYKLNKSNGKYKLIKETNKNYLSIKNLKSGTEYTFSVKAIKKVNSKLYKSVNSCRITFSTIPQSVTLKAISTSSRSVTLSWNKTSCDGYEIYKFNRGSGQFELFKVIEASDNLSYERRNMKRGETCQFKIRAYKNTDASTMYSPFSDTEIVTIKY